ILQYRNRALYRSAMRFVFRHASLVVANSRYTRDLLAVSGVLTDRIVVINPPVSAPDELRDASDETRRIDQTLGLTGRLVLFTAARLVARKGHADVIRTVARLKARANLVYVMTGAGEYASELSRLASELGVADRVVFAGRVSERDLHALYRRADLY